MSKSFLMLIKQLFIYEYNCLNKTFKIIILLHKFNLKIGFPSTKKIGGAIILY